MDLPRRWLMLPALALVAAVALACNGDEGGSTPTGTPADASTPTATPAPEDRFAARSPEDLESYRYQVRVSVLAAALEDADPESGLDLQGNLTLDLDGVVVNPDREHLTTAVDIGFLTLSTETVRIGEDEWTRAGQGPWSPSTPGGPDDLFSGGFSPASVFTTSTEFDYQAMTERLDEHGWRDDEVNGMPARHYSFTEEEFYRVFETDEAMLPADMDATFTADTWLSEEFGVPVRLQIVGVDGEGSEILRLDMDLSDINAGATIEPPV